MNRNALNAVLEQMHSTAKGLTASAIVSVDGLPVTSVLAANIDENKVGAFSAALFSLSSQIARLLTGGNLQQSIIESDGGLVILMKATDEFVLVATAHHQTRMGLVVVQMREAVKDLQRLLA